MAGCLLCLTPPHTNVKRAHQEATLWSRRLFLSICATTTSYSIQNLKIAKLLLLNPILIQGLAKLNLRFRVANQYVNVLKF